jgi:hypothetical protein
MVMTGIQRDPVRHYLQAVALFLAVSFGFLLVQSGADCVGGSLPDRAESQVDRRADDRRIYARNVLHNFVSFNLDAMGFWNAFLVKHNKRLVAQLSWFWIWSLTVLAATGLVWGAAGRGDDCPMVAAIYLGIVVAHAISFATELYTAAKLPLLLLGFALLARRLQLASGNGSLLAISMASGAAGLGILISALALF